MSLPSLLPFVFRRGASLPSPVPLVRLKLTDLLPSLPIERYEGTDLPPSLSMEGCEWTDLLSDLPRREVADGLLHRLVPLHVLTARLGGGPLDLSRFSGCVKSIEPLGGRDRSVVDPLGGRASLGGMTRRSFCGRDTALILSSGRLGDR